MPYLMKIAFLISLKMDNKLLTNNEAKKSLMLSVNFSKDFIDMQRLKNF